MKFTSKSSFAIWFLIPVISTLLAVLRLGVSIDIEWFAGFIFMTMISYVPLFVLAFVHFMWKSIFAFKVTFWTIFIIFYFLQFSIILSPGADGQSAIGLALIPFLLIPILLIEFFLIKGMRRTKEIEVNNNDDI